MKFHWVKIVALATFGSLQVFAFEGWEHHGLGDVALEANLRAIEAAGQNKSDDELTNKAAKILREFKEGLNGNTNLTYGEIVRLVDYMKDNFQLTRRRDGEAGWPTNAAMSNTGYLRDLANDHTSMYQASHENQDHFQGRVFHAYWLWHKEAVATAAEGNLFGALLLNAYADHFLQDSFAPGHLMALRDENSHDLAAVILHDTFNRFGLIYSVGAPAQCTNALQMLMPLAPEFEKIHLDRDIIALWLAGTDAKVEALFHGDNRLNDEKKQPVIIAAYCVQSVKDIVDSYLERRPKNRLEKYKWDLHFAGSASGQVELINVGREYGNLVVHENPSDSPKSVDVAGEKRFVRENREATGSDIALAVNKHAFANPAFGLTIGAHTFIGTTDSTHAAALTEVELLAADARWDNLRNDWPDLHLPKTISQIAVGVGYSGVEAPKYQAHGGMLRLVAPFPRLNLQFSVAAGARDYSSSQMRDWGDFETVRAEWGYQILNLFIGIGHDHFPRANGLSDGISFDGGISLVFPRSRTPLIGW